jgi:hypothetical protein
MLGRWAQPDWSRKIEPKKTFFDYGAAASPVVHDGQVIVVYDNLEASWIAALTQAYICARWGALREAPHLADCEPITAVEGANEVVRAGTACGSSCVQMRRNS